MDNSQLETILTLEQSKKFISNLEKSHLNGKITKESVEKTKKTLLSLPVVQLNLAFEPSQELIEKISHWFLKNYSQKVLLQINSDPSLIAGLTLSLNGFYKDYSLKKVLENYSSKNV